MCVWMCECVWVPGAGSNGDSKSVVTMQQPLLSPIPWGDYAKTASEAGGEGPGSTFPGSRGMSAGD